MKKRIHISLTPKIKTDLEAYKEETGESISQLIHRLLYKFLYNRKNSKTNIDNEK